MTKKWVGCLVMALLLASAVSPASAWVRVGWRGGGWGVGLGWPGFYYGYPWGYPYAYPYDAYAPYPYYPYGPDGDYPAYADAGTDSSTMDAEPQAAAPSGTGYSLKTVTNAVAHARDYLAYRYSDGDISKSQQKEGLQQLDGIEQQARSQASANGGTLAQDQAIDLMKQVQRIDPTLILPRVYRPVTRRRVVQPAAEPVPAPADTSRRDLMAVNDLLLELRTLLDQKLKDEEITRAQRDAEMNYLDRIDKQAQSDANANGGFLTGTQEDQLMQFLHQAYYVINHNFITR